MNRLGLALAVMGLATSTPGLAQSEAEAGRTTRLAPLQFLADHCWQGVFPGSETFDVHCFEQMFDGQYLRDVHAVPRGADLYRGETIYHWDPEAEIIRYHYFNSDGDVSTGTVVEDGDTLRFGDERVAMQDGSVMVLATTWQRQGETAYNAITTDITTGEAVEVFNMQFNQLTRQEAEEMLGEPLE